MIPDGHERSTQSCANTSNTWCRVAFLACGDYSPEFVTYVRTKVPELKCAQ